MQLQKFKPGDLVRILEPTPNDADYGGRNPPPVGCIGSVVGYYEEWVCVEWKDYNKGHNGGASFPSGEDKRDRWFVPEVYLGPAKGVILKQILDATERL